MKYKILENNDKDYSLERLVSDFLRLRYKFEGIIDYNLFPYDKNSINIQFKNTINKDNIYSDIEKLLNINLFVYTLNKDNKLERLYCDGENRNKKKQYYGILKDSDGYKIIISSNIEYILNINITMYFYRYDEYDLFGMNFFNYSISEKNHDYLSKRKIHKKDYKKVGLKIVKKEIVNNNKKLMLLQDNIKSNIEYGCSSLLMQRLMNSIMNINMTAIKTDHYKNYMKYDDDIENIMTQYIDTLENKIESINHKTSVKKIDNKITNILYKISKDNHSYLVNIQKKLS